MKNELNVKQLQKETGNKIKEELSKDFKRVDIGFINLDYKDGKGFVFYLYDYMDNYDYKKINVNFIEDVTIQDYVNFIMESIDKDKNITEHFASAEEKYVIDILESADVHNIYISDGCLCGDGYEIGLDDVEYIAYDKINNLLEIWSDEEKFEIDLINETIEFIESEEDDNAETIDNNFMHKVCNTWNQIKGIWGILLYNDEDECLRIKDIETGNIIDLVGLDDINYIKLNKREKKLCLEYDEDEQGFSSFELNIDGIEY